MIWARGSHVEWHKLRVEALFHGGNGRPGANNFDRVESWKLGNWWKLLRLCWGTANITRDWQLHPKVESHWVICCVIFCWTECKEVEAPSFCHENMWSQQGEKEKGLRITFAHLVSKANVELAASITPNPCFVPHKRSRNAQSAITWISLGRVRPVTSLSKRFESFTLAWLLKSSGDESRGSAKRITKLSFKKSIARLKIPIFLLRQFPAAICRRTAIF